MKSRIVLATAALLVLALGAIHPSFAAEAAKCDRRCLEDTANRYLAALVAHDPTTLPQGEHVKYTENGDLTPFGTGVWKAATEVGNYRIYASDTEYEQIAYIGNIRIGKQWSMFALRLRVKERRIVEAETILPGVGASDATYDLSAGASRVTTARAAFSTALLPSERRDRSQIIGAADLHYEGIQRGNGDIVPFSDKCIKIENGVQTILNPDLPSPGVSPSGKPVPNFSAMNCHDQFNTHIWETDTITDRRYPVVDEERGIVVAFSMYNEYSRGPCAEVVDYGTVCPKNFTHPFTLVIAEAFKVRAGRIEEVEAIFTPLSTLRPRGVW